MKNKNATIEKIRSAIIDEANLGKALRIFKLFISSNNYPAISNRLEIIVDNYERMKQFVLKGYNDPKRQSLYNSTLKDVYELCNDTQLAIDKTNNPVFSSAYQTCSKEDFSIDTIRERLEAFVQDIAMLSLEPEEVAKQKQTDIYRTHQQFADKLFCSILVSEQWNENAADSFTELITSPTIDVSDACLIVSAITLSLTQQFDFWKWFTLANTCKTATETTVRQRALVGWAITLPKEDTKLYPSIKTILDNLLTNELCTELLELQMQLFYSRNADEDRYKVEHDIIPAIMKHNHLRFNGERMIEEEEDKLNEILNPGATDKAMEEVESSMKKMMDMQKNGSDIYFGSFSHMKRFSFFYELSNWFCPFYINHPGLENASEKFAQSSFLQALFEHSPFCDSDKYSFALSMSSLIGHLPPNIEEMFQKANGMSFNIDESQNYKSPAYIRRLYIMDLFRFFRLHQSKDCLTSPFETADGANYFFFTNSIIAETMLKSKAVELNKFLLKRGLYQEVKQMLNSYKDDSNEYKRVAAFYALHSGQYDKATQILESILKDEPNDEQLLRSYAQALFNATDFVKATEIYDRLTLINQDNQTYKINKAISQINGGNLDDGMKVLYELYYNDTSDRTVRRALAWGLLLQKKPDEAERIYLTLLSDNKSINADILNTGYSLWMQRKMEDAATMFKRYADNQNKLDKAFDLKNDFEADADMLNLYGVDQAERYIMLDLVSE